MILLASLFAAAVGYLLVGMIVGVTPVGQAAVVGRGGRLDRWRDRLQQGGMVESIARPGMLSVASAGVLGVGVHTLSGVVALGVMAGIAASGLPWVVIARRCRIARSERLAAWPDALRDLVAHLRSGASMHASLCRLGESGPGLLRPHFARYGALAGALNQQMALEIVREELCDPLSDRVIEVILVAFDQGTSLVVDVLGALAEHTAADLRLAEAILTDQLETRLEARGAAVLPFVVLVLLCSTSLDYRRFYSSALGLAVMASGVVLVSIGLAMIRRLAAPVIEERVLVGRASS